MKILLITILALTALTTIAQTEDYKALEVESEAGKCYSPLNFSDSIAKDSVYLEFVSPMMETQYKTLDEIKKEYPHRWDETNGIMQVSPASIKIVEKKRSVQDYKNVMCWLEVPSRFEKIEKVVIPKATGHIEKYTNRKIKILVQKSDYTIREVSAEEATKSKNPIAKVAKNTQWQEVLLPVCGSDFTIRHIQRALNEKGYYCEVNGILDDTMKHILLEFQEDHELPQGRLDIKLLKALGIY